MANLKDLIVNGSARVLGSSYASTPDTADNSDKVATTSWVKSQGYATTSGSVSSAEKLTTARTIDGVDFDGSVNINHYGVCDTTNSTQTKEVTITGFKLETGASIRVKFTNNQNYNGVPKLNVNGTGSIEIKSIGTTNAGRYYWQAGEVVDFTYDGTYWLMDNGGIASTTYYGKTKLATGATNTSTSLALTPASLNSLVQTMIEPYAVYSTSVTYAVGDRVRYNYQAWECNTAISTAESWNATHWTALDPIQTQLDSKANSSALSGYVPTTRKVNNKALSADITLSASDVGALPSSTVVPTTTSSVTSGSTAALTSGGAYTNLVRRKSTSAATGSASQGVYVDANGQVQTCTAVTSTYSSTGTAPVNGTAVKSAIDAAIASVYKPAGSVAFASLPTPAKSLEGNVYDVTDAFTTDSKFVTSGQSYPAGTNVVVINTTGTTYKYDVLAGFVDLSGYVPTSRKINNKALTADITLSASDVGAVASNTAITGATKCKITYDSKGLVTAGADLAASDIPNLSLSKITDVTATATELNVLDGITASTTELNYVDGVTSNIQTQLNSKANDADVVHKANGETITGVKTFNEAIRAKGGFNVISSGVTKGTNPASTQYWGLFRANDSTDSNTWANTRLGIGEVSLQNNGNTALLLGVYKNEEGSTISSNISVVYDKVNNTRYATLSETPATTDNSTKIATTAFVKNQGYTSNTGTITGITMNGSSKGTSGVVDLGTVLTSHQTIKQDGITGATINRFGTCSIAAGTAAKTVSVTNGTFALETGASVRVKFSNANTASTPTLNVNSTGAKNIFHRGAQITTGSNKALLAGVCDFVYDGTQYHLVGNYYDSDTKNTAGSTDTSSKIFLVGATSQAANPQTYSHDTAFVDANGRLNSAAPASDANDTTVATTKWVKDQSYVPTSRTINSKALSSNITLSASDVGALPSSTVIPTITDTYSATSSNGMSGKAVASAISNKADKATSLSGYGITDAYTKTEIDGKLSGAMHFKGTKASVSNLPTTGNVQGDMWNVTDTGANYAWDGSAWDKLSENIDLSGVVPTSRKINNKALTADITLSASDVGAVASNTAITGATKCKITYDSKGLVTAGANLDASDIPNLSLSKITDVTATATEVNVLDGITATTAELNYTDGVTSNIQTQLNAKAADNAVVKLTGNQEISGTKTFNAEIKGVFAAYQSHNGETGGYYRKIGEIILTGAYQSAVVPFYYYKDAVNVTETGYTGKISLRVDGTAGTFGPNNSGVVLGEYPDWINDGRAAFFVLYKNNTPESNKVTCQVWTYVKNAWDGFKIMPLSYHGYGQSGWTWNNNPTGVTELPSDYTAINQKFARMYITSPNEDTTSSAQLDTVGARNTKLSSYALDNSVVKLTGNQTISGTKTFTANQIISGASKILQIKNTNVTRNTAPSANVNTIVVNGLDSAGKNLWGLYNTWTTGKANEIQLLAYKGSTTDNTYTSIGVGYDTSGNPFTRAPTPATSDNSTKIATTAYVNNKHVVVSTLPASPDANVFYYIPE